MSNDEDVYQEHVLDHYEDPYHRGQCEHATHAHEERNPLCGDIIEIQAAIDPSGKLAELFFDGDGCCISQASASMLVERLDGKTIDEVKNFSARDMLDLFGARLTPNRQKCCLLSWRALQAAIHSPLVEGDESASSSQPSGPALNEES